MKYMDRITAGTLLSGLLDTLCDVPVPSDGRRAQTQQNVESVTGLCYANNSVIFYSSEVSIMGLHSLCNRECTPNQVADIIYEYMVENQSAHRILRNDLGIAEADINSMGKFGPSNRIKELYKSYGFVQKFSRLPQSPYSSITRGRLRQFVAMYWNQTVTEQDLINFFPSIREPLLQAKEWYRLHPSKEWEKGGGSSEPFSFNFDETARRTQTQQREPQRTVGTGRTYRRTSGWSISDIDFSWVKKLLAIILAIGVVIVAIGGVKALISKISVGKSATKSSFGKNYTVETYEYNGHKYIGNQKRNKPDGINLQYTTNFGSYELATTNKKEIRSGEGASYDGHSTLIIGARKKNVFKRSWCIKCQGGKTELAVFKDNMPQGLVICREQGVTRILNYRKGKEIAVYQDGEWKKPNGKPLKLNKNGGYKQVILKDETHFEADGIEFCIDSENLVYDSGAFEFEGTKNNFTAIYNAESDHINITYNANENISMDLNGNGWNLTPQK